MKDINMEKQQLEEIEQATCEENARRTQKEAIKLFPDEQWIDAALVKLKYEKLPPGIETIKLSLLQNSRRV